MSRYRLIRNTATKTRRMLFLFEMTLYSVAICWMTIIVVVQKQPYNVAFIMTTITKPAQYHWIRIKNNSYKNQRPVEAAKASEKSTKPAQQLFRGINDYINSCKVKNHHVVSKLSLTISDNNDDTITTSKYAYLEKVRESIKELSDVDGIDYSKEWDDSIQILLTLITSSSSTDHDSDITIERIESCLADAWNWKRYAIITSPIARKFIKTMKPNSSMLLSSIQWLRDGELKLPNKVILQGILKCPETYLVRPQESYEMSVRAAPPPYGNDNTKFRELLLQYPSVLQCTYNCVDTGCKSECGNCWVSFQYQIT